MEPIIPEIPALRDLITTLEHATQIAKQLPTTTRTDPTHYFQLYSSLQIANHQLSSFLNRFNSPPENSLSSSAICGDEPMQIEEEEEEEEEENSNIIIDKVEEKMRDFFIQNKRRRKRALSPTSAVVEQRPCFGNTNNNLLVPHDDDPRGSRLRAFDLVYQFHG